MNPTYILQVYPSINHIGKEGVIPSAYTIHARLFVGDYALLKDGEMVIIKSVIHEVESNLTTMNAVLDLGMDIDIAQHLN